MPELDHAARFGEIRSLLNEPCGRGVWAALRTVLDLARRAGEIEDILDYVAHHLEAWPDVLRRSSVHWCAALARGQMDVDDPIWQLVRHVQLDSALLDPWIGLHAEMFHDILDGAWLESVTHLTLDGLELRDEHVETLAHRFAPGQLQSLKLRGNEFGEEGISALAAAHHLRGLRVLDLTSNHWGGYDGEIEALVTSPIMAKMHSLMLECDLTRAQLEALLATPQLAELEHLSLRSVFDDEQERAIDSVSAPSELGALGSLDVSDNSLDDDDIAVLAIAPLSQHLHTLRLDWNELTDEGIERLAILPLGARLRALSIRGADVGEQGARALLRSRRFGSLTSLDVSSTYGLAASEAASTQPPRLLGMGPSSRFWLDVLAECDEQDPQLVALNLSDLNLSLDEADAERLVSGHATRELERLELANCVLHEGALRVWLDAQRGFKGLRSLNLNRNEEIAGCFEALLECELPKPLEVLKLRDTGLLDAHIEALCDRWRWSGLEVLDLRGNYLSERVHERLEALVVRSRCDVLWDPVARE